MLQLRWGQPGGSQGENWGNQWPRLILIGRLDIAARVTASMVCNCFECVLRTVDLLAADCYGVLSSTLTQLPQPTTIYAVRRFAAQPV